MCFRNVMSNLFEVNIGVPQGSVLESCPFAIYSNDLPVHLEKFYCELYTHDYIIYTSDCCCVDVESGLRVERSDLSKWTSNNIMMINTYSLHSSQKLIVSPKTTLRLYSLICIHGKMLVGIEL